MTPTQWIVAVMLLLSFIDRTHTIFTRNTEQPGAAMVAFVLIIGWFAGLVMLLHGGGF